MCKSINTIVLLITSFLFSNLFAQTNPLDSAFAQNGVHVVNINTTTLGAIKVAAQSDGKLVMCSSKQYGTDSYDFCVMRFNTDGSIDSTFGLNGTVVKDLQSVSDFTCDISVQKDDKIIVAGSSGSFADRDFALVRFSRDGAIDQGFGSNGIVKVNILYDDIFYAVHVQSDGKILAGGSGYSEGQLYRFLENGTLDPSFGTNGRVSLSLGESTSVYDINTGPNDEIFLAGQIGGTSVGGFVSKLNNDGTFNNSFGVNGHYVINSSDQEFINTIALQDDGKIVTAGGYGTMIGSYPFLEFLVIRLLPDGSYDITFNNTGVLRFSFDSNNENRCNTIVCKSSGDLLATGYSGNYFVGNNNVSIAKIKSDGSFDSTYAVNGKFVVNFGNSIERAQGSILDSDEKLVVSGFSSNNLNPLLCRFLTNDTVTASELLVLNDFKIFPNPATEYISVSLPDACINDGAEFTILDISGHVLQKTKIISNNQRYNIANLKAGIYYAWIRSGKWFAIKKLIIL